MLQVGAGPGLASDHPHTLDAVSKLNDLLREGVVDEEGRMADVEKRY